MHVSRDVLMCSYKFLVLQYKLYPQTNEKISYLSNEVAFYSLKVACYSCQRGDTLMVALKVVLSVVEL